MAAARAMMSYMDLQDVLTRVEQDVRAAAPTGPDQRQRWPGGWLYADAAGNLQGPRRGAAWPTAEAAAAKAPPGAQLVWQPVVGAGLALTLLDAIYWTEICA